MIKVIKLVPVSKEHMEIIKEAKQTYKSYLISARHVGVVCHQMSYIFTNGIDVYTKLSCLQRDFIYDISLVVRSIWFSL